MTHDDLDSTLRAQLHRIIDPIAARPGAEERVMRAVANAAAVRRHAWRPPFPAGDGLRAALVAAAVVLVIGGALGASLSQRNHTAGGTGQPAGHPRPLPGIASSSPPASPFPSPAPTPSPSTPPCDGSVLGARFADLTGAAGTDGGDIVLHNSGAVTCTMEGYTNIEGLDNGLVTQLGVTHAAGGTLLNDNNGHLPTVRLVTLQPGQDAYVAVEYSVVINGPTPCPSYTTLRITPPQGQHAVTMAPAPFMLCGGHGAAIWIDEAAVSTTAYFARGSTATP